MLICPEEVVCPQLDGPNPRLSLAKRIRPLFWSATIGAIGWTSVTLTGQFLFLTAWPYFSHLQHATCLLIFATGAVGLAILSSFSLSLFFSITFWIQKFKVTLTYSILNVRVNHKLSKSYLFVEYCYILVETILSFLNFTKTASSNQIPKKLSHESVEIEKLDIRYK